MADDRGLLSNVGVDGAEGIVHDVDISIGVESTRQGNALLLTPAKSIDRYCENYEPQEIGGREKRRT